MLLPDNIYRRVPKFWMFMGILFVVLGLMAGPDFRYFGAYILLGFASIFRSIWLHVARQVVKHFGGIASKGRITGE